MDVSDRRMQVQLTPEAKIAADFFFIGAIFAFVDFVSALRARGVFRGPCRLLGKKREAGFRWLAAILPCYPSTSRPPAALARFPAGRPAASV